MNKEQWIICKKSAIGTTIYFMGEGMFGREYTTHRACAKSFKSKKEAETAKIGNGEWTERREKEQ